MPDPVDDIDPADGPEEQRRLQSQAYGAPVADLLAAMSRHLDLDLPGVATTIGISMPMLRGLRDGERGRLGNPLATRRLMGLVEMAQQAASGALARTDIELAVAQIASSPQTRDPEAHRPCIGGQAPLTHASLRAARDRVAPWVRPSSTLRWPLLEQATGTETWVKHENHNPTGAFKVRGGLNLVGRLLDESPVGGPVAGLITASRGNHSQSLAFAGRTHGVPVTVVVPEGNSPDKNAATRALGADLVIHGEDFQAAVEHAGTLALERGLRMVPAFHPHLVEGVATYAAELHESVPGLDVVYVPVGMGSGICANIRVRDLLGSRTEIVGVVSERAPAYALSFEAGQVVTTPRADTIVDGVACRTPSPDAVAVIVGGASRILRVSEEQAREAMALMYRTTHNLAEPAGSLALAGLMSERDRVAGHRVAVVHCGGNADFEVLAAAMG